MIRFHDEKSYIFRNLDLKVQGQSFNLSPQSLGNQLIMHK